MTDASGIASVDIVVPCYNYARYLDRCVRSALDQRDVRVRVLVLDDASTDETPVVGARLAASDARVRYERHSRNRGHIATYNEGLLEWAAADLCVLLSADDLLAPDALARAARVMQARPDVGLVYGSAIAFDGEAPDLPPASPAWAYAVVPGRTFIERCFAEGNPVPTPSAVVRTAAQRRVGGYSGRFPHTGDMEMWMRLAGWGPVAAVNRVQALYRRHARNMSAGYYAQVNADRAEVLATCEAFADANRETFPSLADTAVECRRRIAGEAFWSASRALDEGDLARFAACLRFATSADPGIVGSGAWWRLWAKRIVGRGLAARLQALRGVSDRQPPAALEDAGTHAAALTLLGWWPEGSDVEMEAVA